MSSLFNFYSDPTEGRFRSIVNYKIDISSQTFYEDSVNDIIDMTTGSLWVDTSSSDQNIFRYIHNYTGTFLGYKYESSTWSAYGSWTVASKPVWIDVDDQRIEQFKTYVTVSTDSTTGQYTSISDAIDALPIEGGTIFVKEGTYTFTATQTLPDKNITIIGEDRNNVIIQGVGSYDSLFEHVAIGTGDIYSKRFQIQNLTMIVHCSYGILIDNNGNSEIVYPSVSGTGGGELFISDVNFEVSSEYFDSIIKVKDLKKFRVIGCLAEGHGNSPYDDYFFYIENSYTDESMSFVFENNIISDFSIAMYVYTEHTIESGNISGNNLKDCVNPLSIAGNSSGSPVNISNNSIDLKSNIAVSARIGIYADVNAIITGNNISLTDTGNNVLNTYGIHCTDSNLISSNKLVINITNSTAGSPMTAILLIGLSHTKVVGNVIEFAYSGSTTTVCNGIRIYSSDYNSVSDNNILMNNRANDIGIYLNSTSDYNKIMGNLIKDTGTAVDDTAGGTGNDISENTDI